MKVLRQYHNNNQTIVEVTGEFDRLAPSKFLSIFGRGLETHDKDDVVLDMTHAKTVDSTFIGALFLLADKAEKRGVILQIINVSPGVQQILELGSLSYLIHLH